MCEIKQCSLQKDFWVCEASWIMLLFDNWVCLKNNNNNKKKNPYSSYFGKKKLKLEFLFPLSQYLEAHLKFLAFFLQEATLYLGWNRAREIWECLVTGQDVCELDREVRSRQSYCLQLQRESERVMNSTFICWNMWNLSSEVHCVSCWS